MSSLVPATPAAKLLVRGRAVPMFRAVTEQVDRFTLTTGPDGRGLLTLALRRHPRVGADGFAKAQRYWACAPAGAQPRWLALAGRPGAPQRPVEQHDDAREAAEAHAAADAYIPGVACSWCGDRWWKPANRVVVSHYLRTGLTGGCLACKNTSPSPATPAAVPTTTPTPTPITVDAVPVETVEARILPGVTVHVDGEAAAMLWRATGGDSDLMSSLVTGLVSRNFGILRPEPTNPAGAQRSRGVWYA